MRWFKESPGGLEAARRYSAIRNKAKVSLNRAPDASQSWTLRTRLSGHLCLLSLNSELKFHMTMSDWWSLCHMMMPWVQGMLGY